MPENQRRSAGLVFFRIFLDQGEIDTQVTQQDEQQRNDERYELCAHTRFIQHSDEDHQCQEMTYDGHHRTTEG